MNPPKTQTPKKKSEPVAEKTGAVCSCSHYARATEAAALASARWLGRADREGAEEAAFTAMRSSLDDLPIDGRIGLAAVARRAVGGCCRRRAGRRTRPCRLDRAADRRRWRPGRSSPRSARGAGSGCPRWLGRDVDDRDRRARRVRDVARHVHAPDGGRTARARSDRSTQARGREHRHDRKGVRTQPQ